VVLVRGELRLEVRDGVDELDEAEAERVQVLVPVNLAAIHRLVSSEQDQQDQLQPPPRRAGESADPKRAS
jgi:hypothetical protein